MSIREIKDLLYNDNRMIRTFEAAEKFLEKYVPDPSKKYPGSLGLERMKEFCNLFDNPQLFYPTIHVGGTSGKGSTSTIIASILATKHKVGLHTSPHLVRINERIKIFNPSTEMSSIPNFSDAPPFGNHVGNGPIKSTLLKQRLPGRGRSSKLASSDISDKCFISLVNELKPVVEQMENGRWGAPSYFEIVTAMAFLYFKQQKVDIAVIEVGLGGRFDATNVIKPVVAVLTNVGLDHTDVLGNTVEKIAEDKVGIIKPGIQVVSGVKQSSVIDILMSKVKGQRSMLSLLNRDFSYHLKSVTEKGSVFDYKGNLSGSGLQGAKGLTLYNLKLNLLGVFQVENAALAIKAIEKLSANKMSLRGTEATVTKQSPDPVGSPQSFQSLAMTEVEIRKGLISAHISGRLEIIYRNPLVILDGAHNTDKMSALVQSIKKIFPGRKVTALVAIKDDKNAKEILKTLLPICREIIFTGYEVKADQGIIRSYNPHQLLSLAQSLDSTKKYFLMGNPQEAINLYYKKAAKDDVLLITGSLYLVGEIKKWLDKSSN